MTDTWVEVQVEATAEAAELVAATVSELTGGVEIRDAGTLVSTAVDRAAVVSLCRPDQLDSLLAAIDETLAMARAAGTSVDPVTIRRREAREEEWRDVWKQFFRTTRVGQRFIVRPSWEPADVAGEDPRFVVELDPGRAFGTGAHPTTRLVIRFAEQAAERGTQVARFLDLGSGSGILSIVAARLWPRARGWAVDLDPEATGCAAENLARNAITTVEALTGTLEDAPGPFDLVMANIQADVLEGLAGPLAARLSVGAPLVLSGLLAEQADGVRSRYESTGLRFEARADDGEWAALLLIAAG